jgi:nucleotide-binding universal stress UspA family protein
MPRHTYSTILLFAESSESGMKAARDAINLAADEDATLVITAVIDTSTLKQLVSYRIFVEEEMQEYDRELEASCRRQLAYVSQLADQAGIRNRAELVRGACHSVILRQQREHGADLLVMGAFRASTTKRDVMGHEKQLIIDEIPCPVLLVR